MAGTRRTRASTKAFKEDSPLASELEDEIDKFHKARGADIALNPSESDDESLEQAEGVYDLSDDDSEEFDTDEEIERDTHLGKLAKQAKILKAKLKIAEGEEEESSGEEDERKGWGAGRRAYYDADVGDVEASEDEEDLQEEEMEAVRLQRVAAAALKPEDYDQSDLTSSSEEEEEEAALGKSAGMAVETVARQPLSDEARKTAVERDALELTALVTELRASLKEVRERLEPLLSEVRQGGLATTEGVSYLEAKHLLLLSYISSIVFYLLLKAEGKPVAGHPVIARLVEIRAFLDKVKPIDKRLQYQVEKLLAAAAAASRQPNGSAGDQNAGDENLVHGPRPEALIVSHNDREGKQREPEDHTDGVYRPPRINPISMETEEGFNTKERRKLEHAQRRASRSDFVQELGRELAGAPEEERYALAGLDSAAGKRERLRLAAREAVEEELMVRVPLSRDDKKKLKAQQRAGLSGKALLDDFADDVADLVAGGAGIGIDPMFQRHRTSQAFGADLAAQAAATERKVRRSGDDDLPQREQLFKRRAKMDSIRAHRSGFHHNADEDAPEELRGGNNKRVHYGEEDEFYKEAAAGAAAKKAKRREAHVYPELKAPAADDLETGARRISSAIEKNRGLTPHRRKDLKNPRKKHRIKFAEATVRRKGQVQDVRERGAYSGEGTGIKSRVTKSVKF